MMWNELVNVLDETCSCVEKLCLFAQEKHDALKQVRINDVEKLVLKENELAGELSRLDTKRENVLKQIPQMQGKQLSDFTVENSSPEVMNALQRLTDVLTQLVSINDINKKLIQQALTYFNFSINLLTQTEKTSVYGAKAEQELPISKPVCDYTV